jgi:hypothetical protein
MLTGDHVDLFMNFSMEIPITFITIIPFTYSTMRVGEFRTVSRFDKFSAPITVA